MAREITWHALQRIRDLAAQHVSSGDIARHLGLSVSAIHKVRQGHYDQRLSEDEAESAPARRGPKVVWCQRCRCHCEGPCRVCELRRRKQQPVAPRPRAPLPAGIRDEETLDKLELPLGQLGLPQRVVNRLEDYHILTVNDLLHCTREELLEIPHLGPQSLRQIFRALARLGFQRKRNGAAK